MARTSGMPQFLLKPGMAAPYAAIPTPHMFRETVWHCIARPLQHMMYWNLQGAYQQKKTHITQDEVDKRLSELLGPEDTLDYATVAKKITGHSGRLRAHSATRSLGCTPMSINCRASAETARKCAS